MIDIPNTFGPVFAGIDPGLSGAIAVISGNHSGVVDIPTIEVKSGKKIRRVLDEWAMRKILHELTLVDSFVIIESVNAMPGQGVTSMFRFGEVYGQLRGMMVGLGIRYETVHPLKWKRHYFKPGAGKDESLELARKKFPGLSDRLSRKKDHNRGEALLLAEWGQSES